MPGKTQWELERERAVEELFAAQRELHEADPYGTPLYPPPDTGDELTSTEAWTGAWQQEPGA